MASPLEMALVATMPHKGATPSKGMKAQFPSVSLSHNGIRFPYHPGESLRPIRECIYNDESSWSLRKCGYGYRSFSHRVTLLVILVRVPSSMDAGAEISSLNWEHMDSIGNKEMSSPFFILYFAKGDDVGSSNSS